MDIMHCEEMMRKKGTYSEESFEALLYWSTIATYVFQYCFDRVLSLFLKLY
jgi:hypothetical protein